MSEMGIGSKDDMRILRAGRIALAWLTVVGVDLFFNAGSSHSSTSSSESLPSFPTRPWLCGSLSPIRRSPWRCPQSPG